MSAPQTPKDRRLDSMISTSVATFLKLWLSCFLLVPALVAGLLAHACWRRIAEMRAQGTGGFELQLALGGTYTVLCLVLVAVTLFSLSRLWRGRWLFWAQTKRAAGA